jgi:hypothetical protein
LTLLSGDLEAPAPRRCLEPDDAGLVDDDVQRAEFIAQGGGDAVPVGFVADVQMVVARGAAMPRAAPVIRAVLPARRGMEAPSSGADPALKKAGVWGTASSPNLYFFRPR